jgi:hypothetical protein
MAVHKVGLKVPQEIELGKVDITLPVRRGGSLLGTLTISRGGVDWKKAHAHSSVSVTWTKFAELMTNA